VAIAPEYSAAKSRTSPRNVVEAANLIEIYAARACF
jgi:hypothetical protein